jgi:hypothetical protein
MDRNFTAPLRVPCTGIKDGIALLNGNYASTFMLLPLAGREPRAICAPTDADHPTKVERQ